MVVKTENLSTFRFFTIHLRYKETTQILKTVELTEISRWKPCKLVLKTLHRLARVLSSLLLIASRALPAASEAICWALDESQAPWGANLALLEGTNSVHLLESFRYKATKNGTLAILGAQFWTDQKQSTGLICHFSFTRTWICNLKTFQGFEEMSCSSSGHQRD